MALGDARVILHVDMDAFFASVELLRHPELRGKPVVVGGTGARGVVAAASYEARAFGVHSAMPSVRARRLCPDVEFLAGDHKHYSVVSAQIMGIFKELTPLVEPLSLDEAFLDLSGSLRLLGPPHLAAEQLRDRIFDETGLRSSMGIARNKFLAKLATNRAKPKPSLEGPVPGLGVFVLDPANEAEFLSALPIERLWGVGPATLAKLAPLKIRTVGDVARTPKKLLSAAIGLSAATRLSELSRGIDDRPVIPDAEPKSISHEETFSKDLVSMDELRTELIRQSEAVASRMRALGFRGRTVQLKLRYQDFRTLTRSHTVEQPTDRGTEILNTAWTMLLRLPVEGGIRLIGVGVANLTREPVLEQLSFDDLLGQSDAADGKAWDGANSAVDEIRSKFGAAVIGPARLSGRYRATGDHQWGPDQPGE